MKLTEILKQVYNCGKWDSSDKKSVSVLLIDEFITPDQASESIKKMLREFGEKNKKKHYTIDYHRYESDCHKAGVNFYSDDDDDWKEAHCSECKKKCTAIDITPFEEVIKLSDLDNFIKEL